MQNIIKLITVSLFVFILGIFYLSLNRSSNYDTKFLVGNKIADIKLQSLKSEKFFTNDNFKNNKYTLINFWASWCAPCKVEHPFLMELSRENNLKILGVNFKDKKNNASIFLKSLGNPYDYLAKDELGKQSINFGIYGIPESILINKEFTIIKKFVGPLSVDDVNEIKTIVSDEILPLSNK